MVQIQILCNDETQAKEIALFLLQEKLILDVCLSKKQTFLNLVKNDLVSTHKTLLTAKTKSLLFKTIDEKLKANYKEAMPLIWSLAITHMDWEQAEYLIKHTASV